MFYFPSKKLLVPLHFAINVIECILMKKLFFTLTIGILLFTTACSQKTEDKKVFAQETSAKSSIAQIENLGAGEFRNLVARADSNTVILDVRTAGEYTSGHIQNSINLDFYGQNFKTELAKLDTSKTYLVYCRTGHRSGIAANYMVQELGFTKVKNLSGGYVELKNAGN